MRGDQDQLNGPFGTPIHNHRHLARQGHPTPQGFLVDGRLGSLAVWKLAS